MVLKSRRWLVWVLLLGLIPAHPIGGVYKGPFDINQIRSIVGGAKAQRLLPASGVSETVEVATSPPNTPRESQTLNVYAIQHIHPMDLKQLLTDFFPNGRFSVDIRNRTLLYWASESTASDIKQIIQTLDVAPVQIQVAVQVIETSGEYADAVRRWLVDLSKVSWSVDLSRIALIPDGQLDGFLGALQQSGKAILLSKPTITTNDSQKASIKVGDRVPYLTTVLTDRTTSVQVNQVDTGVALEVLPQRVSTSTIHLDVMVSVENIKRYRELGGAQYPVLTRRLAQTVVDISDGDTLVIAGLLDDQRKDIESGIPAVSNIPIVGELFKGKSIEVATTDVMVLITPRIIKKKEALR